VASVLAGVASVLAGVSSVLAGVASVLIECIHWTHLCNVYTGQTNPRRHVCILTKINQMRQCVHIFGRISEPGVFSHFMYMEKTGGMTRGLGAPLVQ
jgi:hypothetical protein